MLRDPGPKCLVSSLSPAIVQVAGIGIVGLGIGLVLSCMKSVLEGSNVVELVLGQDVCFEIDCLEVSGIV